MTKYAIIHKHTSCDPLPEVPVTLFFGLPRPFDTQRDAYLHAKKIFGSQYDSMAVRIVEYAYAARVMAVHVNVRSGRLRPKNGKNGKEGYYVDESRRSYSELRPGLVDGYKREMQTRREAVERRKVVSATIFAAKVAAAEAVREDIRTRVKGGDLNSVKGPKQSEAAKDKALRIAIYQETGDFIKPNQGIKPLENMFEEED